MKWKYETLNDGFLLNENVNYSNGHIRQNASRRWRWELLIVAVFWVSPMKSPRGPRGNARQELKQGMCFWMEVSEEENGTSVKGPREWTVGALSFLADI